jgi:hypothetical protein
MKARERASFKARALGWPNYFELDTGENFSDATTDKHLCAGGQNGIRRATALMRETPMPEGARAAWPNGRND